MKTLTTLAVFALLALVLAGCTTSPQPATAIDNSTMSTNTSSPAYTPAPSTPAPSPAPSPTPSGPAPGGGY